MRLSTRAKVVVDHTGLGFLRLRSDWPDCRPIVRTIVRTGLLGTLSGRGFQMPR